MRFPLLCLLVAGSGLVPCTARAGAVVVEHLTLDEGNSVAQLEATSQYYVDAMRSLIAQRYPGEYRARRWEALETAMRDTPVARFEYHYQLNGQPVVRVYHAMGGRPLGSMARSIFEGDTPPGTPTHNPQEDDSWSDSSDSEDDDIGAGAPQDAEPLDEMAQTDLDESPYYDELPPDEVRAGIRTASDTSLISFDAFGRRGVLEAEYKALRALEDDLAKGVVPGRGVVRGLVADAVCSSCRYAMDSMARIYDVDVHLTQVFGSISDNERRALIGSGKARMKGLKLVDVESGRPLVAYDALYTARSAQVRAHLSPRAMNNAFRGLLRQRSFRLAPPRLPRVSEGSSPGTSPANRSGIVGSESSDC